MPACILKVSNFIYIRLDSKSTNAVLPMPVSPIKITGIFAKIRKEIKAILIKLSFNIPIFYNFF